MPIYIQLHTGDPPAVTTLTAIIYRGSNLLRVEPYELI